MRAVHGDLTDPPDVVAFPTTEADVVAVLDWCGSEGVAAIPYGGGSSVVGGVECAVGDDVRRRRVDRPHRARPVLEIDATSPRRADPGRRPRAGARGPAPPARLHAAPLPADRSSSRRSAAGSPPAPAATTPPCTRTSTTSWSRCGSSRRPGSASPAGCPGRGAGPSPDRLFLGSEGSARHHHRGVDAGAGPAALAGVGGRALRAATPTASRPSGPSPVGAVPDQLPPARRRRGGRSPPAASVDGGAARARLRVGRPPGRRRGSTGPSSCAATTAASVPDGVQPVDSARRGRRSGRTRRRRRRRVARRVPAGAVPARRAGPHAA